MKGRPLTRAQQGEFSEPQGEEKVRPASRKKTRGARPEPCQSSPGRSTPALQATLQDGFKAGPTFKVCEERSPPGILRPVRLSFKIGAEGRVFRHARSQRMYFPRTFSGSHWRTCSTEIRASTEKGSKRSNPREVKGTPSNGGGPSQHACPTVGV